MRGHQRRDVQARRRQGRCGGSGREEGGLGTAGATALTIGIIGSLVGGVAALVWAGKEADAEPEELPPADPPAGSIDEAPLRVEF